MSMKIATATNTPPLYVPSSSFFLDCEWPRKLLNDFLFFFFFLEVSRRRKF
jgi:hypothetical protein